MRKIGVICSGGDAPGMNAALRAIVRRGISRGLNIVAIH
ncbi:MAG: 6-phosphofructokinase, partial [Candidatus Hodarchaeales archaeon]